MPANDPVRPSVAAGRDPGDRALIEFSMQVAAAHGEQDLRRALRNGLDLLARIDGFTHYAICEISVAPAGRPLVVWQVGRAGFTVAENDAFRDWFERSRSSVGIFVPARGELWCGLLAGAGATAGWESFAGLFLAGEEPGVERWRRLALFADLVVAAFTRIHHRQSESLNQDRLKTMHDEASAWLEFGTDVLWQADADGTIRCCRVLNRRHDVAAAIEGMNLRELIVGGGRNFFELLTAEASARHLHAQIFTAERAHVSTANALYVSGAMREPGAAGRPSFLGSVTCAARRTGVAFPDEAAVAAPAPASAGLRHAGPLQRASHVIERMWHPRRNGASGRPAVPVGELVARTVARLRPALERASVEIETDIAPDLAFLVDSRPLQQVLMNVVQNAADAISGNGDARDGHIRVLAFRALGTPAEIVLRVEDNGPGFPPAVTALASGSFPAERPGERGAGYGLSTCSAVIRELGGRLVLGNHAGGGFVTLFIPAAS